MLNFQNELEKFGLNPDNSIVIGSGILNALGLRESQDIDLVISKEKFEELEARGDFRVEEHYGRNILCLGKLELGTNWQVLGGVWNFADLFRESILINHVRYCKLEFILQVKRFGLDHGKIRQKDYPDIKIIEEYLAQYR